MTGNRLFVSRKAPMISERLGHYRLLGKLGTGGMGEVYLAEDTKLGRRVALKILPQQTAKHPERLARFQREAKAVAAINHPSIVTIHSVEEADGTHFITMELVEGEPLTAILRREGLALNEVLEIILPLTEAIEAAHRQGITHRDLKPDNVMVTPAGKVKVLDFGLAKASGPVESSLDASGTETEMHTQEGQILGTVFYMSPEQAEGRAIDHRSDIFSLGIMLYEMLSGFRPFRGESKVSILSSILRDTPQPIQAIRRDLPPEVGRIVERCLEKSPDRRYQSARDLRNDFLSLQPAMPEMSAASNRPATAIGARIRRARLLRVSIVYLICSFVTLFTVRLLVRIAGLPDWTLPGAIALLVIGLPILLATALIQGERRSSAEAGGPPHHPGGSPQRTSSGPPRPAIGDTRRWLTWKKAIGGGVLAFALWGALVAAYVVTRDLGIGPAASLVTSGALAEQDRVLVADFENQTGEEGLGSTVKEALAIDLAQSPTVQIVPAQRVGEILRLMERSPDSPLDLDLARDLAERDGIKAVVAGQIHRIGEGYVLTARLISAQNGEVLGAYRATGDDAAALIPAIDRLSKKMRSGIGESLKSIRSNPPLDRVTTQSLEALRKYSLAIRKIDIEGDSDRAIELLEEATALDSTFAMAHRKLGTILSNTFQRRADALEALRRAYRHRDRLPERERFLTDASYFRTVTGEPRKAIHAYERLLEMNPRDDWALNNLGVICTEAGDDTRALEYYRRSYEARPTALNLGNIATAQGALGQWAAAESTLAEFARTYPGNPEALVERFFLLTAQYKYEEADEPMLTVKESTRGSAYSQARAAIALSALKVVQGRLREGETYEQEAAAAFTEAGMRGSGLELAMDRALIDLYVRGKPERGAERLDRALEQEPIEELPQAERPYLALAGLYALLGRVPRAQELASKSEGDTDPGFRGSKETQRQVYRGTVALAQNRPEEAIVAFRAAAADRGFSPLELPLLAAAYEESGRPDSALAIYERYVTKPDMYRIFADRYFLGITLLRLAEMYDHAGNEERALEYYRRFVELWEHADPELQGRVAKARRAMARIAGEVR